MKTTGEKLTMPETMISVPRAKLSEWRKALLTADFESVPGEMRQLLEQPAERDLTEARYERKQAELYDLLRLAREFVTNGVDLGYILMPEADTPDPAHDLVSKIDAALRQSTAPATEACPAALGAPVWYEHTLRNERGEAVGQTIADHQGPAFGKPDVDYDKSFSVDVVALYKSPVAPASEHNQAAAPSPAAKVSPIALREAMENLAIRASVADLPPFSLPAAVRQVPTVMLGGVCVRVSYSGLKWYHDQLVDDRWEPLTVDEFEALLTEGLAKS
ncbi:MULTISPECIES: hypothetical protein [Pseudomonas]|uniref:hypothetical protein n=1 Tax=Pseudomonas TaxID=286 RepID=UPI000AFBBA4E|nr:MULTISPECIES: hypothetical protein [Pseudomonas]MDG9809453.1 hypothetical protein [Pseudomonas juntendi]MDG9815810.1 hypothetical protein [Pseudomonas putida]